MKTKKVNEKENTTPCPECGSYRDHEPWCPFYTKVKGENDALCASINRQ